MKRLGASLLTLAFTVAVLLLGAQPAVALCHSASFSEAQYSVAESAGAATITVDRPVPTGYGGCEGNVDYSTSDGTAKAGADYTATSGTLHFGLTETAKTFQVPIKEDSLSEGNENVNLTLTKRANDNITVVGGPATLTITDNDPSPAASPSRSPKASPKASPSPSPSPSPPPSPSPEASPVTSPTPSPTREAKVEDLRPGTPVAAIVAIVGVLVAGAAAAGLWWLRRKPSP